MGSRVASGRRQCPLDRGRVREVVFSDKAVDLAAHDVAHPLRTLFVAPALDERCSSSSEDDESRVNDDASEASPYGVAHVGSCARSLPKSFAHNLRRLVEPIESLRRRSRAFRVVYVEIVHESSVQRNNQDTEHGSTREV